MRGSYLGPNYNQVEIENSLKNINAKFKTYKEAESLKIIANYLKVEKLLDGFESCYGIWSRALEGRSILADPRSRNMQKKLNLKIKFRESFRPFAPSILIDDLNDWFDLDQESPYMLLVSDILKKRQIKMTEVEENLFGIDN